MADKEIRNHLVEVIVNTKTCNLNDAVSASLADAILKGLERRGVAVVSEDDVLGYPDEHLKTLKSIRRALVAAVEDVESKRDLSSLTKRLSDVSREIVNIEERHRAERAERGRSNNGNKNSGAATSAQSGPLSI